LGNQGSICDFSKGDHDRTAVWFILWLLGCIAATLTKVWDVGNAAHVVGLLFGAGIAGWGLWPQKRNLLKLGFIALFLLSVIPVFWAPWSSDWTSQQGMHAYERGNYAAAIKWYNRSMVLGQDKAWCLQSIGLAYFEAGDKAHYQETLESLRKLDEKTAKELEEEVSKSPSTVQDKH
jgi:GlpG protein